MDQAWWGILVIPAMGEAQVRGSRSKASLGKISRPYLENKQSKKDRGHGSLGRVPA
jgi:hypothetical protein